MAFNHWLQRWRYQRFIRASRYRKQLKELPPSLLPHWQAHAKDEFTGVPSDMMFFAQAAEGLMMFFDCVRRSERSFALPSKAADSVWHAWLDLPQARFSEIDVDSFCRQHFGREIPHVAAAQMDLELAEVSTDSLINSITKSLANSLVQLRHMEGKDALSHTVPALFSLDRRLAMPRGFSYSMKSDKLGYQHMSLLGQGSGAMFFPAAFMPSELLALGLVSATMLEHYQRKQAAFLAGQNSSTGSTSDSGTTSFGTSDDSTYRPSSSADNGANSGNADSCVETGSGSDSGASGSSCGTSCGSSCGSSS